MSSNEHSSLRSLQITKMDNTRSCLATNCRSGKRGLFVSVVILGLTIGSALLAYTAFAPLTYHHRLRQVAIIFRHGDRTPTETYKNDPYKNYEWEDGWGALTKKGMAQEYNLGQWIRSEYGQLIGDKYESSKTLVRSSYADRCIMSAQALLAGLYRPDALDYFLADLPWRPVPVHPTPRSSDKLIVVAAPCPRLAAALAEAYQNESRKSTPELESYYAELTNHTGQKIATITDVEFLYNTLEIEEDNGLVLPKWTSKFYNSKMRDIAARSLAIFTSNTLQQRLRGGPLLKEILDHMIDAARKKDHKKLYMYSAHDITLVNVLRTMGFTEELFKPEYGAALIFELLVGEGDRELEVQVKYLNNTESIESHPVEIPACREPCGLSALIRTWKDVLPTNWDAECVS